MSDPSNGRAAALHAAVVGGGHPHAGPSATSFLTRDVATAEVLDRPVAHDFARALGNEFALSATLCEWVETALHEAVVNAAMHGNLEVPGPIWIDPIAGASFSPLTMQRLRDPYYADRLVRLSATLRAQRLDIVVSNAGPGFDPESIHASEQGAYSGRGLRIIRELTRSLDWSDAGRTLTMEFGL